MRHGVLRNDNDRGLGSTVVGSDGRSGGGDGRNIKLWVERGLEDGVADVVADMLDSGGGG